MQTAGPAQLVVLVEDRSSGKEEGNRRAGSGGKAGGRDGVIDYFHDLI